MIAIVSLQCGGQLYAFLTLTWCGPWSRGRCAELSKLFFSLRRSMVKRRLSRHLQGSAVWRGRALLICCEGGDSEPGRERPLHWLCQRAGML